SQHCCRHPYRKTDQIRTAWAAGDRIRALRIAARFFDRSTDTSATNWVLVECDEKLERRYERTARFDEGDEKKWSPLPTSQASTVSHLALIGFAAACRVVAPVGNKAATQRVQRSNKGQNGLHELRREKRSSAACSMSVSRKRGFASVWRFLHS